MTFSSFAKTCKDVGFTVITSKKDRYAVFTLSKQSPYNSPPLTVTLTGRTCKELEMDLERIAGEFDIDSQTYSHLAEDGHGKDGYPHSISDILKVMRWQKDELDMLRNDCSDALLPVSSRRIPNYELRRRTKELLDRWYGQSGRLIERAVAESDINPDDTENAHLLPLSLARAIFKWLGNKCAPDFALSYVKGQQVVANEKRIYDSL